MSAQHPGRSALGQPSGSNTSSSETAPNIGDQAVSVNGIEQDIWEKTLDAISQYQDQFSDDIKLAEKQFAESELESIAHGDTSSETAKENLGYALVSGGTNAAIDATVLKTGDPLEDTMNVFAHTLNNMPSLDWSLSGALGRVKEVAEGLKTGPFGSALNDFAERFKQFSGHGQ